MNPVLQISNLSKVYAGGLQALSDVSLNIDKGEIFALLGPNGAGKTTLISAVCGMVTPTSGSILVNGFDAVGEFRQARASIGLVPQEISTDMFEPVESTVSFSRGLFGRPPDAKVIERVLRQTALWDKRKDRIRTLSGGMKRRVMIAKALAHEPEILFLDEPTAGVDVELRRSMWNVVHELRRSGVTIILTTHYIEEAEEMADRIGVISDGRLILVEDKEELMQKLGRKQLQLDLQDHLAELPSALAEWPLTLEADGWRLDYTFDVNEEHTGVARLLSELSGLRIAFKDLNTKQSSLEQIFVDLVNKN